MKSHLRLVKQPLFFFCKGQIFINSYNVVPENYVTAYGLKQIVREDLTVRLESCVLIKFIFIDYPIQTRNGSFRIFFQQITFLQ